MSRELKFRCWNNCAREYIPQDELMNNFGDYLKEEHLYIEQYTGLEDQNGKEIYGGDIVQRDDEEGTVGIIEFDENEAKFVINDSGVKDDFDFFDRTEWGIIGNIHENPELLEGEK